MGKIRRTSFLIRLKNFIIFIFSIFSSVLFWFIFVSILFALLIAYDISNLHYTSHEWWEDIYSPSLGILIGSFTSFLFYFLVVFLPERKKRNIIKANFEKLYKNIKKDILYQIIFASQKGGRTDLSANSETLDSLMTIDGFRATFEGGREGNEGFYAFRNYIGDDVPEYREIILSLQVLSKQVDFILHNYPITSKEVFDFFKRLEIFLMRIEKIGPGYEEEKPLSRFIWEIYAGASWIEGNRGYDIIEKMIEEI